MPDWNNILGGISDVVGAMQRIEALYRRYCTERPNTWTRADVLHWACEIIEDYAAIQRRRKEKIIDVEVLNEKKEK